MIVMLVIVIVTHHSEGKTNTVSHKGGANSDASHRYSTISTDGWKQWCQSYISGKISTVSHMGGGNNDTSYTILSTSNRIPTRGQ